jgi:integrase/recombinase XerD
LESEIRGFLNYLRVEKALSQNTLDAYRRDLAKFTEYAAGRGLKKAGEIKRSDLLDFLATLYTRRLDARSVARYLVSLRQFFRFLMMDELITEDPSISVESPKFRKSLPEFLSVEEVELLLMQPDASTATGLRDKAMIELLYSSGLRVSELCGLSVDDLHPNAGSLRCVGKGNKERLVPVGRNALAVIQEYLKRARPEILGERTSKYLFVNRNGNKLVWTKGRTAQGAKAAHAPAQLRNPSARSWRRSALRAANVGSFRHIHNTNLHTRGRRAVEKGL